MHAEMKNHLGLLPPTAGRPAPSASLNGHLAHCTRAHGRMHALRALAEAAHAALLPRFVSTVAALVALALGIAWLAG
jgi:hypothetical protein